MSALLSCHYMCGLVGAVLLSMLSNCLATLLENHVRCQGNGQQLKYLWGDALTDSPDCLGPNNVPYPTVQISRTFQRSQSWGMSSRAGRSFNTVDPQLTRKVLIKSFELTNDLRESYSRSGREFSNRDACSSTPARLCKTRYNTTAPMYGVSLTSGQPVTIVQKFPDLLQQVVYEVCESSECDVVRGECTQTYVPYLFLVIPLGPVTLTGQDYVLVESGCVCKPKYAANTLQMPVWLPLCHQSEHPGQPATICDMVVMT
ncbi:uncharacterized protein LOC124374913 [Homalodisca vitripennis]|uniref:uncharacterized protein LOC124374913 n=1 Tax=Homalodisca vitripennis TaxID=197043 RepID=UPI001EEB5D45|nr:uncharacterized protein LOC124374913 [Homalodisca vitripennis]